jgi:hypothetical protein
MQAVLCDLAPDALATDKGHGRATGREPAADIAADASGTEDADAIHRTVHDGITFRCRSK